MEASWPAPRTSTASPRAGGSAPLLHLEQSQYVGPAPVPFASYEAYMRAFAAARRQTVTRSRVRNAFGELVLSDRVLDQLGPAVNGGHSMFVYGSPGNGKTVISQSIRNLLDGEIAIPYAIEAHGHIIQLYDAVVHQALPSQQSDDDDGIDAGHAPDRRWVRCRRPLVMVGGELMLESLDLAYGQVSKFYQAPVQMAANGGVLVIDDFGRQRCSPAALLNRWITPLESRVDYLTLQTGQKLPMPFVVLIVFATNINPTELVDEAFLRRIHYKVYTESPTLPQFRKIFERCCQRARPRLRRGPGGVAGGGELQAAWDPAPRMPSEGPHRAGDRVRRVFRRTQTPDGAAAEDGLRNLLRRRRRQPGIRRVGRARARCLARPGARGRRPGGCLAPLLPGRIRSPAFESPRRSGERGCPAWSGSSRRS